MVKGCGSHWFPRFLSVYKVNRAGQDRQALWDFSVSVGVRLSVPAWSVSVNAHNSYLF